jgi:hypothetical protein
LIFGGFEFSTPVKFPEWLPPYRSGVYSVLMKNIKDQKYYVIYIGESVNLSERGFLKTTIAIIAGLKKLSLKANYTLSCLIQQKRNGKK